MQRQGRGIFPASVQEGHLLATELARLPSPGWVFVESHRSSNSLWIEGRCLRVSADHCKTSGTVYKLRQGGFFS